MAELTEFSKKAWLLFQEHNARQQALPGHQIMEARQKAAAKGGQYCLYSTCNLFPSTKVS